jgi:hypothetical protein
MHISKVSGIIETVKPGKLITNLTVSIPPDTLLILIFCQMLHHSALMILYVTQLCPIQYVQQQSVKLIPHLIVYIPPDTLLMLVLYQMWHHNAWNALMILFNTQLYRE